MKFFTFSRLANVIAVIGVVGALGFGTYLAVVNVDLRAQLAAQDGDLRAAQANGDKLYEQLLKEGISPSAEKPSDVAPEQPGTPGRNGIDGVDGQDGHTPTYVELFRIVGDYCTSGGTPCKGDRGDPGPPGQTVVGPAGADSTTPGPQGPPGADSTVPGPAGAPGRGIASGPTCNADGTWTTTFTDGTTETQDGPCRVSLFN